MRETLSDALKVSMKAGDKRRTSTLRLMNAAIKDRDIAARTAGTEKATGDELLQLLAKMIKQREESARMYEEGGRAELALQEREEIEIIREYLPRQMTDAEVEAAVRGVVTEIDAKGLRDVGRVMAALKERYTGQMDFGKASGIAKALVQ
jgi:uncharacterized protein YqeY